MTPAHCSIRRWLHAGWHALLLPVLLTLLAATTATAAPMRGSYLVGRGGAFRTIAWAMRALEQRGLSGSVTLRIRPGTYRETVRVGAIRGLSASRTLVLRPATTGGRVLLTSSRADSLAPILLLDSATRVTVSGLSFHAPGGVRPAVIRIARSSRITIENCTITADSIGSAGRHFSAGIFLSSRDTLVTIRGNRISGTDYGIKGGEGQTGENGPSLIALRIEKNRMSDLWRAGVEILLAPDVVVERNRIVIHSPYQQLRGIQITNCAGVARILANRIELSGSAGKGIFFQFSGSLADTSALIANNLIRSHVEKRALGETQVGIEVFSGNAVDVIHNTVRLTSAENPPSQTYSVGRTPVAFHMNPAGWRRTLVVNNIFSAQRGWAVWPVESFQRGMEDYNLLHSDIGRISFLSTEAFHTEASWRTKGNDRHSVYADPKLDSNSEMRPVAAVVRGRGHAIVDVAEDIDGRARHPLHPDIGAHESVEYRGRRPYLPFVVDGRTWRYARPLGSRWDTIRFRTGLDPKPPYTNALLALYSSPDLVWYDSSRYQQIGTLREDRLGRVHLVRPDRRYVHGFTERLLFDFRASAGDTLDIAVEALESTERVVVIRVDSIRVHGVVRRRLHVGAISPHGPAGTLGAAEGSDLWIEGVGGMRRALIPMRRDPARIAELICLTERGKTLYGDLCREQPSDIANARFYRLDGPPRLEVIDSIIHLIVAPQQQWKLTMQYRNGSHFFLDTAGRGPAILGDMKGHAERGAIYWILKLPHNIDFGGWIGKME